MTNLNHSRELYLFARKALNIRLSTAEALSRSSTELNAVMVD